jgi:hypothetical protein
MKCFYAFNLLFAAVSAITLLVSSPPGAVDALRRDCRRRLGPNYRFAASNIGVIVGDFEDHFGSVPDGEDGVRLVSGRPGEKLC